MSKVVSSACAALLLSTIGASAIERDLRTVTTKPVQACPSLPAAVELYKIMHQPKVNMTNLFEFEDVHHCRSVREATAVRIVASVGADEDLFFQIEMAGVKAWVPHHTFDR